MQAKSLVTDLILKDNSISQYLKDRGVQEEHGIKGRGAFCCPLHTEDTPSFIVYPPSERYPYESYFCFGCKKSGNLITLKMALEGLSGKQVVANLSDGMGIQTSDEIDYVIKQLTKENTNADLDDFESDILIASRSVYHHLQATSFDEKQFFGCENLLKHLDDLAEQKNRDAVKEVSLNISDCLGSRLRAFQAEREKVNAEAARTYAKI